MFLEYTKFSVEDLPDNFPLILGQEEWNKVNHLEDYAHLKFSSSDIDHLEKVIYFYLSFFPAPLVYLTSRRGVYSTTVTIHYEISAFQDGLNDLYQDAA